MEGRGSVGYRQPHCLHGGSYGVLSIPPFSKKHHFFPQNRPVGFVWPLLGLYRPEWGSMGLAGSPAGCTGLAGNVGGCSGLAGSKGRWQHGIGLGVIQGGRGKRGENALADKPGTTFKNV